jgi:predicted nucleotidyltransferase
MTRTSLDISGKIEEPALLVLRGVDAATCSLDLPFFLIGATARDVFIKHLHGLSGSRMTRDMDFGVSLSRWEDLSALKTALIERHGFEGTNEPQGLRKGQILIDLVPFGRISGRDRKLLWPPDKSRQMTTAGFDEAFKASVPVKICASPELVIRVCSLAGLVILKLIAWHERYPERQPDADDILEIMDKYEYAVGIDRLYSEAQDLLIEEGFDNRMAAIKLLGHDIAGISAPDTASLLVSVLDDETREDSHLRLAIDMARGSGSDDAQLRSIIFKLSKLRQGIDEERLLKSSRTSRPRP